MIIYGTTNGTDTLRADSLDYTQGTSTTLQPGWNYVELAFNDNLVNKFKAGVQFTKIEFLVNAATVYTVGLVLDRIALI